MEKKHFNIPIFIPELACPFQCIYCDQSKISGVDKLPDDDDIRDKIEGHLRTMPLGADIQLAYFGGNFTGIPIPQQEHYLKLVLPYIESGRISGIRLSTRPDYINDEVLALLKKYRVVNIELGAQSLDEEVLKKSHRGHTVDAVEIASRKIRDHGFSLGLQMMIGLPGDTLPKSLETAHRIVALVAEDTRIYPALVIRGTALENLYRQGKYQPMDLSTAVWWCSTIIPIFESSGVKILKVGLHPSEGLLSGDNLVAGPFYPSFRELVETQLWNDALMPLMKRKGKSLEIEVGSGHLNTAIGHQARNKAMLKNNYGQVRFSSTGSLKGRNYLYVIQED